MASRGVPRRLAAKRLPAHETLKCSSGQQAALPQGLAVNVLERRFAVLLLVDRRTERRQSSNLGASHQILAHQSQSNVAHVKPDYGLDAPGIVRNLALGGLAAAIVAGVVQVLPFTQGDRNIASGWFGLTSVVLLSEVCWMLYSSRIGKLRMRELVVDSLGLSGNETVLDVGCGRGLLLVAAARRLPDGEAVGLDLWSARDLSGNARRWRLRTRGWKESRNASGSKRPTCARCPSLKPASTL